MAAKPITLSHRAPIAGELAPQPLVFVDTLAAAVPDAAGAAPTAAEFKALLDSLRAAGILAAA